MDQDLNPKVSIIMPVYNAERYLRAAIESILNQTYKDFELVVIDDGSTDKSKAITESYSDPRIRLISRENRGVTVTLNEGLSIANGEYIARMDADDLSAPTRLEKEVAVLDSNERIALVGSNYITIDEEGNELSQTAVFTDPDDIKVALIASNQYGHGSIMLRKSVLAQTGPYDSTVGAVEDYDLWCRISHYAQVANIEEPLYYWRRNPIGVSYSDMDKQIEEAYKVRDREFGYFLAHRKDYRLFKSWHPGAAKYSQKKSLLFGDFAYLYRVNGYIFRPWLLIIAAVLLSPGDKRNYLYFFLLFSRRWINQKWRYAFL